VEDVTYELQSQSMDIDVWYLSRILVHGRNSNMGGGEVNLSQLIQLRMYAKESPHKVISKETFLEVVDSHIKAISGTDEQSIHPVIKMSYSERQELKSGIEQIRRPPLDHQAHAEQVRKIYDQAMNYKTS